MAKRGRFLVTPCFIARITWPSEGLWLASLFLRYGIPIWAHVEGSNPLLGHILFMSRWCSGRGLHPAGMCYMCVDEHGDLWALTGGERSMSGAWNGLIKILNLNTAKMAHYCKIFIKAIFGGGVKERKEKRTNVNLKNKTISSPIWNWMTICWVWIHAEHYFLIIQILDMTKITIKSLLESFTRSKIEVCTTVNYEILIRILHSFLNRIINIIMDCFYARNLKGSQVI